jgi:hypothetical protein
MGAGTSDLRDDIKDVDRAFQAHQTDYYRFPSTDGVALRTKVDAHLAQASVTGSTQLAIRVNP